MNLIPIAPGTGGILYPESDGQPMADNTRQGRWIVVIYDNLSALFRGELNIFVAQNLLWYVLEGHPELRIAPNVLVVFGRPKGDRGSYMQWEEGGVPLTVVFEILSPSNTGSEMADKFAFYEEYGVEEYYVYDPDTNRLHAFFRSGTALLRQRPAHGLISPRLGIRFDLSGPEMVIFRPDGQRFLPFEELQAAKDQLQAANAQLQAAKDELQLARDQAEQRALRLATLARKARQGQASAEELRELERLEEQTLTPPSAPERPA
jgi:Uma2 family endonuclease